MTRILTNIQGSRTLAYEDEVFALSREEIAAPLSNAICPAHSIHPSGSLGIFSPEQSGEMALGTIRQGSLMTGAGAR